MDIDNEIIISKELLKELKRDSLELQCLREFGVDNWDGYGDAMAEAAKYEE